MISRLAIVILLAAVLPAAADQRGSNERIARFLKVAAERPQDPAPLVELGANYAVRYTDTRNKADRRDADAYFNRALKLDPKLAAPGAWRGLMRCSEARGKLSFGPVKDGLAQIDAALQAQPENLDVRVMRASLDLELPGKMGRLPEAASDLALTLERCTKDPAQQRAWDIDLSEVHMKLGKAYRAQGDLKRAKEEWEAAVKASSASPEGQEAARLLTKFR